MASWCYNQDFKEEEQASGSNEKKMILAVEDDKVTLSEDSGEKALTPEDLINKVLMADEGADKVTVVPEVDDKYIAYASKGKAQHSYIPASSYQDEWVITSYFICLGKTRWEQGAHEPSKCGRLMTSKQWDKRKHDTQEAWVPQQKWYCKCSSRYKAGWGQVVIIEEPDGTVSYVRAECPSWDTEDIRAMKTEATVSAERVKELYDKIRSINPSDIVGMDADCCKYIKKYEDLPFFSSEELLTLMSTFSDRL